MSEQQGPHDDVDVPANLADLVRRAARRAPEHPALLYESSALLWAELDAAVDRAAAAFVGLGLSAGDRIAVQLGNTPDFPIVYFGALRAGLVAVPTNPGYTEPELSYLLADAGAAALVTSSVAAIAAADHRRRGPRRADLHQRHQRPPPRRDAHPPRAAGEPRPVRPDHTAGGAAGRRDAAGAAAVPRLRAEPGPGHGGLGRCQRGVGGPVRPGRDARADGPTQGHE